MNEFITKKLKADTAGHKRLWTLEFFIASGHGEGGDIELKHLLWGRGRSIQLVLCSINSRMKE